MSTQKDSYWIPLADLMTVLMVIFLFMSVSYMIVIKKKQADNDKMVQDYEKAKVGITYRVKNRI